MKTVKSFRNYDFENCNVEPKYWGDYPHANFFKGEFIPVARKELKKMAANMGAELASFNANYFEYSAFFKKDDKFIYVRVGDVRLNDWYNDVLYRTAAHDKDWHGGTNHCCSYDNLEKELTELFNRM